MMIEYPISFERLNNASAAVAAHRLACNLGASCPDMEALLKEQELAMNEIKRCIGPSREWLRQMADAEDTAGGSVSVGGMAEDLGIPVGELAIAKAVITDRIADLEHQILVKDARVSELDRKLAESNRIRDFNYRDACRLEQIGPDMIREVIQVARNVFDNGSSDPKESLVGCGAKQAIDLIESTFRNRGAIE